jgi:lysyl-tRNA synthetase class 2
MNTLQQDDQFYLARKARNLRLRAEFLHNIRNFFSKHDFLEIETPVRIPGPAPEEHIEAIPSGSWFLQTSPELCMKRLLAAGYPRIFQICKCFRDHERGQKHLPEFTMLEWYVAHFDYHDLMDQCEAMLRTTFSNLGHNPDIIWQSTEINLAAPWERITVADAFARYSPVGLSETLNQNSFDEMLVQYVEPRLGISRPTFLYDYPAEMAALARIKNSDPTVAERFELYIGGLELANGFSELTDADEQRKRFEKTSVARAAKRWQGYPIPEKFLTALEHMPPCAGIALGIDRTMMLLANTTQIDDITAFPPDTL